MFIREFSRRTGVPAKTIRFYESKGLLPRPPRAANNYRQYSTKALERLRFIAAARALGFSLKDVAEFLRARDDHQLPCQRVLDSLETRVAELDRRIADMVALRATLTGIQAQAKNLPRAQTAQEECVCYLLPVNHIEESKRKDKEK